MKQKIVIWILSLSLVSSVAFNIVLVVANLSYIDREYGHLAEQHLTNIEIRKHLEESNIKAVKAILDEEIETKGQILAVCLLESCSNRAKQTVGASSQH